MFLSVVEFHAVFGVVSVGDILSGVVLLCFVLCVVFCFVVVS